MVKVTCRLKSLSPYSQSKYIQEPKLPRETAADWEERCWRKRLHVDDNGYVYIPPMAIKNALSDAAKYISMQVPGKGKATYTKHFMAGVLCVDQIQLGVKAADVEGEWLHVPSDGKPGGSKRVLKCFPKVSKWEADAVVYILDEAITQDVFERHLKECGGFIGLGRFRPRNNGFYGRFEVKSIKWEKQE